ncbi:hypothetical protein [Falsiroseomonas sp. HW251]|uniref:hypothetical protein n=1 Tax=Falsiroseomonas sp. HW251 TaxID=3390998 RepID=UPI003D3202DB
MVASGAGVAALPVLGCPAPGFRTLAVRPLTDPVVEREVGLIRAAARDATPAVIALQEIAIGSMRRQRHPGLTPPACEQPPGARKDRKGSLSDLASAARRRGH